MANEPAKRLGRGLDALLGDFPGKASPSSESSGRRTVPLALIHRNPRNPRTTFRPEDLDDLAASIKAHGIVQPIVVRRVPGDGERYEIIAGERRWRAAQMAGQHEVPITILDVSDRQALELAIVENVQRADLNPVEEARGYQALIDEFGYTQADLGQTIGKSRVHVTNTLRLLRLPDSVLSDVQSGALSAGHARALVTAQDPERLAQQVLQKNLSVRQTEALAQAAAEPAPKLRGGRPPKDPDIRAVERDLAEILGLKVDLRHGESGAGEMRISYKTLEQLEELCHRIRG
jgi:ParB family chromosome partitioning protein